MAERRMFAKTIIDSDAFLDMPQSTQLLYFHLSMRADDDGFINKPKSIMRTVGCKDDDIKVLISKKFIIPFDSGVVVIKHWRIHNYIQKDRYIETKYKEEKSLLSFDENNSYTFGEQGTKSPKALTEAQQKRLDAKKESSLPSSFEYKIRQAFYGKQCPICGCTMSSNNNLVKPTIQHNVPISLGGKHEIDNISVICSQCNTSIRNRTETPPYNTEEVKEIWEHIGNVSGMDTQVSIGKDRLGKDRLGKSEDSIEAEFSTGADELADTDEGDKLQLMGGTVGQGVLLISDNQIADLINQMGLDGFQEYGRRVSDYIINKKAKITSAAATILKWWQEDLEKRGKG